MIEINLLPEEMKKKVSPFAQMNFPIFNLQKLPVLTIAAVFAGILVVVQVLVIVMSIYSKVTLNSLAKKYDDLAPKKREADALKAKSDAITKRVNAIDELMGKRLSWAKKLNALSDSMTPGIWLNEMEYDERPVANVKAVKGKVSGIPGRLLMNGFAAGSGEQGLALIGKFITSLKGNEAFYSDFSDIELIASKSDKVEGQEVMNFKIGCVFK
jgi:Tfp pilus assembly protein PilN